MKISHLSETSAGATSSGSVAFVSQVLSTTQKRTNPSIYKGGKVGSLFKGKQTDKPFANSISEGIEQSIAVGFNWSTLDEDMSMEDKMSVFEEFYTKGNLTESVDDDKKDYFVSLFNMSVSPIKGKKYIVVPLSLVGNRILPLDSPSIAEFVAQGNDRLTFNTTKGEKTYPSKTMRDLSIFNTFTFPSTSVYDKFRTALSLKFDISLPDISKPKQQGVAEASSNAQMNQTGREEVESLDELSKDTLQSYKDKTLKTLSKRIDSISNPNKEKSVRKVDAVPKIKGHYFDRKNIHAVGLAKQAELDRIKGGLDRATAKLKEQGVAEESLNEFAITPDDGSDGKQAGRWLVTYMIKNGITKEKIIIGKNANSVAKYFEFKYRRKPLSVVPYVDDMDLRGSLGLDEQGLAESSEIKIPTEDGITMQDIRLMAGEGPLTKKTVLQAIAVIRKQRRPHGVAEGYDDEEHPIRDDGNEGIPGKQRYPGKLKTTGAAEDLNEFAVDGFGNSGDHRSKLLASVGRLFDAGNKVDWQVPGQMGHVTRVQDDGITMKKWQMPRSKMSFFLPMRDDSRDSKYTIKMVAPKHYAVVSAEQGVEESTEQGQNPTTWYKDNKPFSLTRDGSNFHLVDQSGNIVRNLRIPPRYIPMNLEDEGYRMSNTGREYYKNPNWFTLDEASEDELDEKAVSKQQQKFFGMAHAIQKGEKVKGASPELKKVAKTMGKQDVKDFASTKHKGLPKKVSEVAPASDLDVTVDPELKKTIGFAQAHYPASKNSSDAFHKFVQRSIKHGKEDDNRQNEALAKIENEILALKSKLAGMKSIPSTVEESEINEEDLILVPGHGHRLKPGLLHKAEVSINPVDAIRVDIPLLIRLLEYAREDASGDLDLHDLAEKLVALSDRGRTLTMRDYERVVDVPEEQVDEVSNELAKSYLHGAMRDTITNKKDRNPGMKRAIARLSGTNKPLLPTVAESKSAIMSGLTK